MDENEMTKIQGDGEESQEQPRNKMEALLEAEGLTINFPTQAKSVKVQLPASAMDRFSLV